jgi:hypothetical protein
MWKKFIGREQHGTDPQVAVAPSENPGRGTGFRFPAAPVPTGVDQVRRAGNNSGKPGLRATWREKSQLAGQLGAMFSAVIARESGQSSIPETAVLEPIGSSLLGRPVKPGDDIEK